MTSRGRNVADTVEDLTFLDDTGVCAIEAAQRLHFATAHSLYAWLREHDEADLWKRLHSRDPIGADIKARPTTKETPMTDDDSRPDSLQQLLDEGRASTRKRITRKAERAAALLDELRRELDDDRSRSETERAARAEVEKLERKLAEARAKLRPTRSASDSDGAPASTIRAWARDTGIECPPVGVIPRAVRDAYDAAHRTDDPGSV